MSRKWPTSPITKLLWKRQKASCKQKFLQTSLSSPAPGITGAITKLGQSNLVRGGLVVGAGILAGNVTGFFRVLVTAWFLGTHARADALAVAIGPIDTLTTAIINTMLVSFVPMLTARHVGNRAAVFERARSVFTWILFVASASIILFAPELISMLGPGLAVQQHDEAVTLLRIIAPAIFFGGISALCSALLYTERRFLMPALYQVCVNGSMILCAVTLWPMFGAKGFAIGYVSGSALQMSLTWFASRDLRRSRHRATESPPALMDLLRTPGMYLAYASLISANVLLTRAFATHGGPGMAAAFDYCLRCIGVVIAYLVYPIANSLLPEIAHLRSTGNSAQAYRLMNRSLALMAGASVLACLIGIAVRRPAIRLLFERGSFTAESTALVSAVFLGLAPCIIGWTLLDLVARCYFALDRPQLPLRAAFIPVTLNLAVLLMLGKAVPPAMLGLGMSVGLAIGFLALFFQAFPKYQKRAMNGAVSK
jgi:putative peptidoglycan lipid II flippase